MDALVHKRAVRRTAVRRGYAVGFVTLSSLSVAVVAETPPVRRVRPSLARCAVTVRKVFRGYYTEEG